MTRGCGSGRGSGSGSGSGRGHGIGSGRGSGPNHLSFRPRRYYAEQIKTIVALRLHSQPGMPAPYGLIAWEMGVGIAGHSMGGQATALAACYACANKYGIVAAALHHPAPGALAGGTHNIGANITVPTAVFTSGGDNICPASGTRATYMAMNDSLPAGSLFPRMYRNLEGSSHLEPVLLPPIENPLLATYTAAWFKVHQQRQRNGTYYDLLYGSKGGEDQICKHDKMVECEVVGEPCMPTPCDSRAH